MFPDGPRAPRALDLGAGTGAVGRALRAHFGDAVAVVGVDRVPGPGVLVADVTDLGALARVVGPRRPFELVVAAHVLNELFLPAAATAAAAAATGAATPRARPLPQARPPPPRRPATTRALPVSPRWCARWCDDLLAPDGTLILLEPALRETSRPLLAVRDRLLATGLKVVAPCFWTGPCPALARERDWCHDAAPPLDAQAAQPRAGKAQSAGVSRPRPAARVDFSYLVLRRAERAATGGVASGVASASASGVAGSATPPEQQARLDVFRVVSDRLVEKGRLRVFGCGPTGRHALIRLDRHASTANQAFAELERGDVVRIGSTTVAQDGLRIERDTPVVAGSPLRDG